MGKGNYGQAYSGYDVNIGKKVAIKVIKINTITNKVYQKLLESEIKILKEMNLRSHPNILQCYDVLSSVNNCYIVTELCDRDLYN